MNSTQLFTLLGIAATCFTAFAVAHMHRKQIRQIELFKLDQTAGLIPPPSPITSFVKSNFDWILGCGLPALALTIELTRSSPVSRWTILVISVNISLILVNIIAQGFIRLSRDVTKQMYALAEVQLKQAGVLEDSLKVIRAVVNGNIDHEA